MDAIITMNTSLWTGTIYVDSWAVRKTPPSKSIYLLHIYAFSSVIDIVLEYGCSLLCYGWLTAVATGLCDSRKTELVNASNVSRSTHSLDARSSHSSVHIHPTACTPTLTAKILWTASLCMNGVKWVTRGSAFALRVSRIRLHDSWSQVVGRRDDFCRPANEKLVIL